MGNTEKHPEAVDWPTVKEFLVQAFPHARHQWRPEDEDDAPARCDTSLRQEVQAIKVQLSGDLIKKMMN